MTTTTLRAIHQEPHTHDCGDVCYVIDCEDECPYCDSDEVEMCGVCSEPFDEHCPECESCGGADGNCTNSYCDLGQS